VTADVALRFDSSGRSGGTVMNTQRLLGPRSVVSEFENIKDETGRQSLSRVWSDSDMLSGRYGEPVIKPGQGALGDVEIDDATLDDIKDEIGKALDGVDQAAPTNTWTLQIDIRQAR
jgi:hypothetical protein